MPLIIEGNKRGVKSNVFWSKNAKYNNPEQFLDVLKDSSVDYNFDLYKCEAINDFPDITFMVEGIGLPDIKYDGKKVCLTSMRDFTVHYPRYIDKVNNVVFCSKFFANHYGMSSDKILYIGSPKYDVVFNRSDILDKYDIKGKKSALVIFPLFEFLNGNDQKFLLDIYDRLRQLGYDVIVKTRGKNKVAKQWRGDKYFEDYSWFPHTTMELISVSDIVINFDSTAIKECVMLDTPVINFSNKPTGMFSFLYNDSAYSSSLKFGVGEEKFKSEVERLVSGDFSSYFNDARDKYLFQQGNVSGTILEEVL